MRRDSISEDEALDRVQECAQLIMSACEDGTVSEVDNIIADNLGLEPDYLEEILKFK